jgi:autotransporter-associated beta strand protein
LAKTLQEMLGFVLVMPGVTGTGAGSWTASNGTLIFDGTSPAFTNESTSTAVSAILGINIQLNAGTAFDTVNPGAITEATGNFSGVGKRIVAGDGTILLSGTNTYTGGTTINGGTLEAAHATAGSIDALGSGFVMLHGGTQRSTVTGTLSNSIRFGAGFTSTLSAATGQTLTLNTFVTIVEANARFGSTTDNGTIVFAPIGTSQNSDSTIEVAGGTLRAGNATALDNYT